MLCWLFLPSSLLAAATLTLSLLLLATILKSQKLWQELHYLLLANILLSDLAYLVFYMLISSSNLGGRTLCHITCGVLTDVVFATYTSTILSFMATMLHTYLAVAYPLCYFFFMSCEAVQKVVALIWLLA